jgi:hypothetical protein
MGMKQDGLMMVKAQIFDRLDAMTANIGRVSSRALLDHIDDIRHTAQTHGLDGVASIAVHLERAMAGGGGLETIRPYADAMRDAMGCQNLDPTATATLLASIGQRLYR